MSINKYGNDFKNNIMWNKEYPFIPEITNDDGFTIHEDDIVEFYDPYDRKYYAARVCKIYNKDLIWTRYTSYGKTITNFILPANRLLPHDHSSCKPPKYEDFDTMFDGCFNWFEHFLGQVYSRLYSKELSLPNDWHFDEDKFTAKRLEEVAKIKNKY